MDYNLAITRLTEMNMMNQKNNYQLLSLDMDGTLLNSAKQIPCETTAAIQKLMERGVEVVVGTGRGLAELADYRTAFQGMHYGLLSFSCLMISPP